MDDPAVRVGSLEASEALSQLFAYRVVVATAPETVQALEDALGQDASLTILRNDKPDRVVHGIVSEVLPDGSYVGSEQARTVLLIEPRLANLRYSGGFRMFQNMSVKDIATKLLAPEKIDTEWRLRPDAPSRDYRTQLDESDLDFLSRLLADEGIHFYFDLGQDKTTVVFTNSPLGFAEIDGKNSFDFHDTAGAVGAEHVRRIGRAQRVRTGAVEHRDYDFTKPRLALVGRSETGAPQTEGNAKRREWRDYPGGFLDPAAEGTPRAQMRLQELRSDSSTFEGTVSTLRLAAGKQFTLAAHRDSAFNKKLLVTRLTFGLTITGAFREHSGGAAGSSADPELASFQAVLADQPIRPPRRSKPHSRLQTARVVGPKEGDPNVDEFGRINVQFMWDRDGQFDQHSSCAIRMGTPIAHGDEGFWSAHRVGSEVLVDFLDGDIDRPVVIGAVYNGREKQPYKQPGNVSRSTWKVRGIPGGAGYNEITFENQSGSEQIIVHAQKDLNETILHSHTESIGVDQTSGIGNNQSVTVGADQTIKVGSNQTMSIGANRSLTVTSNETISIGANQSSTIGANRSATVTSNESLSVAGTASKMVALTDTVVVGAARSLTAASETVTVGTRTKTVATSETLSVGAGRTASIGGDESVTVAGQRTTSVGANDTLSIANSFAITAGDDYALKVGDASVTITKGGDIVLKTGDATLSLAKDGTIGFKGKNVSVEGSSDVNVKGDNVTVKGSKVDVN